MDEQEPRRTLKEKLMIDISGADSVNARYNCRLTWYSTTLVVASRETW